MTFHDELKQRQARIEQDLKREYPKEFQLFKKDLVDYGCSLMPVKRVAELGCIWGVDGFYGRYIAETYKPEKVFMADAIWNDNARNLCKAFPQIEMIEGDFTRPEMPARIGPVDVVVLFDILLHMVAPDWDAVLRMYAPYTQAFWIVNRQFTASPITVRLMDLGKEEYFRNIPHKADHPTYKMVFDKLNEVDPRFNKIHRDVMYVWQWGITNHDLIDTMDRLGFELQYLQQHPAHSKHAPNFENVGFIFKRRGQAQATA